MTYYYLEGGQRQKDGTIRWFGGPKGGKGEITLYADENKAWDHCKYLDALQEKAMARSNTPKGSPFEELRRIIAVNVEVVPPVPDHILRGRHADDCALGAVPCCTCGLTEALEAARKA